MLTITFKNVGHGDTIIIEWKSDNGTDEIGIIDCNLKGKEENLAIKHIKEGGYKKIGFMMLTHPHTDHFSGFPSLLEFCEKESIIVERFLHTAIYNKVFLEKLIKKEITLNDFFSSLLGREEDRNTLKRLFLYIHRLEESSIIKEGGILNNTSKLRLNKELWLDCLSPSDYELKRYYLETFELNSLGNLEIKKRKSQNNPRANLLSSFIMILTDNWHILLPSDSTKSTIKRIMGNYKEKLNGNKLIFSQIPRHGSHANHYEQFWANIQGKKNIPVFVSVGEKYAFPSKEVIQFFDENYKEIHATNYVGGLEEYCEKKRREFIGKMLRLRNLLDMYDIESIKLKKELDDYCKSKDCGEKQIKIEKDGTYTVVTNPENLL